MRPLRRRMQLIHQNPSAALDPRLTAEDAVAEPLRIHGVVSGHALRDRVAALLAEVGLPSAFLHRFPHELSGGQKQRVCIARALALEPDLLVLDEPTSALDVSVQAQILDVLEALRARRGLAYLFISHNLAVVRQVCERVAVMYLGRIVEEGSAAEVLGAPRHPYTRACSNRCRASARRPLPPAAPGEPPNPASPPPGCAFNPRCAIAVAACRADLPPLVTLAAGMPCAARAWADRLFQLLLTPAGRPTGRAPCFSISRATSPLAFASSTKSRRKAAAAELPARCRSPAARR